MQHDGLIQTVRTPITAVAENSIFSVKNTLGDRGQREVNDVNSDLQMDHNGLELNPLFKEVVVDGFSILSFKSESDLLLFNKQRKDEKWEFTSTHEEKTKRPYRLKKDRRPKHSVKNALDCGTVCDSDCADARTTTLSDVVLQPDSHHAGATCFTNGSPELYHQNSTTSFVPDMDHRSSNSYGISQIGESTSRQSNHCSESEFIRARRCYVEMVSPRSTLATISCKPSNMLSSSMDGQNVNDDVSTANSSPQGLRCPVFGVTDGNSCGPHSADTTRNLNPPSPMVATASESMMSTLLQQPANPPSLKSRGDAFASNNVWCAGIGQRCSSVASSVTSTLRIDCLTHHTCPSEITSDDGHRVDWQQRRSTPGEHANSSSASDSGNQCRGFSVAVLADEPTHSAGRRQHASDSSTPSNVSSNSSHAHKSRGTPCKHYPEANTGTTRCSTRPYQTHVHNTATPHTPSPSSDSGRYLNIQNKPSVDLSPSSVLSNNTMIENPHICQRMTPSTDRNTLTSSRIRLHDLCSYQQMGVDVPLHNQSTCASSASPKLLDNTANSLGHLTPKQVPFFSDPQIVHRLMGVDVDVAKRLSTDTHFADLYARTLHSIIESNRYHNIMDPQTSQPFLFHASTFPSNDSLLAPTRATNLSPPGSTAISLSFSGSAPCGKRITPNPVNSLSTPVVTGTFTTTHSTVTPDYQFGTPTRMSDLVSSNRPSLTKSGMIPMQHSQSLINAAYSDCKLLEPLPHLMGQPDVTRPRLAPDFQLPLLPPVSLNSLIPTDPLLLPLVTSSSTLPQAPHSLHLSPYSWCQRPNAPREAAASSNMTTTMSTYSPLQINCTAVPNESSLNRLSSSNHIQHQNPLHCPPYPLMEIQSASGYWDAYFKKLIDQGGILEASQNPLSLLSNMHTISNRSSQASQPTLSSSLSPHKSIRTSSGKYASTQTTRGYFGDQQHRPPHVPSSNSVQPNRYSIQSHVRHNHQGRTSCAVPTASQASTSVIENRKILRRGQPVPVSSLYAPAYSDKVCGGWADAHIRIARYIRNVRRQNADKIGGTGKDQSLAIASQRCIPSNVLIRPVPRPPVPLLWPGMLPVPNVPQPAIHLRQPTVTYQTPCPPLLSLSSSMASSAPVVPSSSVNREADANFLSNLFGGLLDQCLTQTACQSSQKDPPDQTFWRSALDQFCSQLQPVQQSCTSADALKSLTPFCTHLPTSASLSTDFPTDSDVRRTLPEIGTNNTDKFTPILSPKRRRIDVTAYSSGINATAVNLLQPRGLGMATNRSVSGNAKVINAAANILNGYHFAESYRHLYPRASATSSLSAGLLPPSLNFDSQLSAVNKPVYDGVGSGYPSSVNAHLQPSPVLPHHPQRQLGLIPPR